jgi:rhamnulokinase
LERIQSDPRALVAIDLGAESCRVSVLRWQGGTPHITMLHRIGNAPIATHDETGEHLHWPLDRILEGIEEGLRKAADAAPEGIRSLAVDGWAVDYVRLGSDGAPLHAPFCYRDERTLGSKSAIEAILSPQQIFSASGAFPLRINTVYQLFADQQSGIDPKAPWVCLPEYVLHWLGGRRVAEYTNATHTGLVDIEGPEWSEELFERFGLSLEAAPPIVLTGTKIGKLGGPLADLPAFADTDLIVPACHDTASAIAAICPHPDDCDLVHTAYIISGTWSLVGTLIDRPIVTREALAANFTNQGAASGQYCFHTNVNGMWILKQCLDHWASQGRDAESFAIPTLVARAAELAPPAALIDVDAPSLLLTGLMPERINQELTAHGHATIADVPGNEPVFARLIFSSLALRYAAVLRHLQHITGRTFHRITILGGGSRNQLLTRLTEDATGLPVLVGEAEGSTLGNFAVQLAALSWADPSSAAFASATSHFAAILAAARVTT